MKRADVGARPGLRGRGLAVWAGLVLGLAGARAGEGESAEAVLNAWLDAQRELKSWSAEFIQTRTLKALQEPLRTPGRLWFVAPDWFRWELGAPPQTLAVRRTNELLVLYPRLKRAERYPLGAAGGEPWRDALMLLEAGFPSSRAGLEGRFRVLTLTESAGQVTVRLAPRSASARRFLKEIRLTLRRADRTLAANELVFADGSTLRNDFTNAVANPPVAPGLFEPALPEDFTIVEPAPP